MLRPCSLLDDVSSFTSDSDGSHNGGLTSAISQRPPLLAVLYIDNNQASIFFRIQTDPLSLRIPSYVSSSTIFQFSKGDGAHCQAFIEKPI